jgi:hypothetical protein
MVIEKELLEINAELENITNRIEKALTALDKIEEKQTMQMKDTRKESSNKTV